MKFCVLFRRLFWNQVIIQYKMNMESKLCIYFCSSLLPEVSHLLKELDYPDVSLKGYPANCTKGFLNADSILDMIGSNLDEFSKIIVFAGACRSSDDLRYEINSKIEVVWLEQCFEIFHNLPSIYHFIRKGNYLVTNGWLKHYKQHIREWGFTDSLAKSFFGESTKKLLLLDTGLPGDYNTALTSLADYMGLPYDILPVGNSYLRLFIESYILKWRAAEERSSLNGKIAKITSESADYAMLFSQLKKLIDLTDEGLIIEEIANLIDMLFIPQQISYKKYYKQKYGEQVFFKNSTNLSSINDDNSLLIEIEHNGQLTGSFKVSGIQFKQHRSRFNSILRVISQIGGLSIANARKYSELEIAKQTIEMSQKRFRAVMEQAPSVIEMYDLKGVQISVNKAYEELWGFPASHTLNKFNILKSEEVRRSGLINYVLKAYAGESVKVPEYQFDSTGRTEGKGVGRKRWLSTQVYPLKDINNKVQTIIVAHEDITEQKEIALLLSERSRKFKQLSQSIGEMLSLEKVEDIYSFLTNSLNQQYPDAILLFVTIDEDNQEASLYNIQGISSKFIEKVIKLTGFNIFEKKYKLTPYHLSLFKSGELYHFTKGLAEFSGSEVNYNVARLLEKMVGINQIYTIGINKGQRLFAAVHMFNIGKNPINDNDYIELYVKLAAIVIEKKQAEISLRKSGEELNELNAQKDKFFSIISHDLKSPFSSILGFSEVLMEQIKDEDYEGIGEYTEIIRDSSRQAMDLLTNLLEWTSSESGRMKFNPGNFDLVILIKEIRMLLGVIASQKAISVNLDLPKEIAIHADKTMVSTVLRNLVSNAIKFTGKGGEITVSAEKKIDKVVVFVKDNGMGIDKARLEKLFTIGESESTQGTNHEKGTGLGLILCKEFIQKHGGEIWVESEQGVGSVFYFTIPYNVAEI